MPNLRLSLALGTYDFRNRFLSEGTIKPQGIDLIVTKFAPPELFRRMMRYEEFDVSEMSMSNYIYWHHLGSNYIALPIFPSRVFRHANIFVTTQSGIKSPKDLEGKKLASWTAYYETASIWQRGILQHEYGVMPNKIQWFTEEPERIPIKIPNDVSVTVVEHLLRRLEDGAIDGVVGPPGRRRYPIPNLNYLFPNPKSVEKEYYKKTGIFPIMHVIIVRKSVWQENKWIAPNLMEAFANSKRAWYEMLTKPSIGGPAWAELDLDEERSALGADPYPYGIEPNRKNLETLIQYCSEQAVMGKVPTLESLFVDNV